MVEIVPAILPKDFFELQSKLSLTASLFQSVQIDICDGIFVPSKTWPYTGDSGKYEDIVSEKKGLPFWENLDFEIDLMVKDIGVVGDFVRAGASRIVLHIESAGADSISEAIKEWKHAVDIVLATNINTSISYLETFLHEVKEVQCMGIGRIGFQGEPFDKRVLEKVAALSKSHSDITISVDGGVSLQNARVLVDSGASRLVVGSALFKGDKSIKETLEEFKSIVA